MGARSIFADAKKKLGPSLWLLACPLLVAGCWKLDYPELLGGSVAFGPEVGAPDGWKVTFHPLPLECPDGSQSQLFVVHPEEAEGPMPYAVVYHSGPFDYVFDAPDGDPLDGPSYQPTLRLTGDWAFRKVFTTLGMYPNDDPVEDSNGALVTALAEAGIVSVLPANCWGDLWHNYPGIADNDVATDGFTRQGRVVAEWAWRLVSENATFAPVIDVALPFEPDQDRLYAIGVGEGGRAVGELFHAGYTPTAALVDSTVDSLDFYYDEAAVGGELVPGLDRIFPAGRDETGVGSLAEAPFLSPRFVYLYSSSDILLPPLAYEALLERLSTYPEAWVQDVGASTHVHVLSNANLAREAVAWLLEATPWEPDVEIDTGPVSPLAHCLGVEERDTGFDFMIDTIVTITYDGDGLLADEAYDLDADGIVDELHEYDEIGQLVRLTVDEDDDGTFDGTNEYTYDTHGNLTSWLVWDDDKELEEGCWWTRWFDTAGHPDLVETACDHDGDGSIDQVDTVDIVGDWLPEPQDTGDTADTAVSTWDTSSTKKYTWVASLYDTLSDGVIDAVDVHTYEPADVTYAQPTGLIQDLDANDVVEHRWVWTYNALSQPLFTARYDGIDDNADYIRLTAYDDEGRMLTDTEDEDGDGTFELEWVYTYDEDGKRVLVEGDELVDGLLDHVWTTTWTCPEAS